MYSYRFSLLTEVSFPPGKSSVTVLNPNTSTSRMNRSPNTSESTRVGSISRIFLQLACKDGSASAMSSSVIGLQASCKNNVRSNKTPTWILCLRANAIIRPANLKYCRCSGSTTDVGLMKNLRLSCGHGEKRTRQGLNRAWHTKQNHSLTTPGPAACSCLNATTRAAARRAPGVARAMYPNESESNLER